MSNASAEHCKSQKYSNYYIKFLIHITTPDFIMSANMNEANYYFLLNFIKFLFDRDMP